MKETKQFLVDVDIQRTFTVSVWAENEKDAYNAVKRAKPEVKIGDFKIVGDDELVKGYEPEYVAKWADDDGVYIERCPYTEITRVREIVPKWDITQEPLVDEEKTELPF